MTSKIKSWRPILGFSQNIIRINSKNFDLPLRGNPNNFKIFEINDDIFINEIKDFIIIAIFGIMALRPNNLYIIHTENMERKEKFSLMNENVETWVHKNIAGQSSFVMPKLNIKYV